MNDTLLKTLLIFLCFFIVGVSFNLFISLRTRNIASLKKVLGWLLILPPFAISAYFGGYVFLAIVMLIVIVGIEEFYYLAAHCHVKSFKLTGTALGAALPLIAFLFGSEIFHMSAILFTLGIFAMPIYKRQIRKDLSIDVPVSSVTILGILYVALTSSYFILIRNMENGLNYLLFFFLITIGNDIFAYYSGKIFGKTKLFSRVSPNKTLQGSLGGLGVSVLIAYLISYLMPDLGILYILLLGAVISIVSQLGDLVESSLKREAHIKDSGKFLPGIGGILDRIDSLLYAAPVVYFFLFLIIK
ncbi:MAG: phosphatidate cytidylyltransferase [Candidatus Margulisiibacteriota bacterium]|nr:phosphatidate cytidylyltransferase [Candidatus Margulisiibacteriota bacterium]